MFDEHLRQLDATLAGPSTEVKPFVRAFMRPQGSQRRGEARQVRVCPYRDTAGLFDVTCASGTVEALTERWATA